ncbi:hypothetical protein AVO42_10820 [Thiomicrospira sp. XS5]|uniref:DUF748 domain-containing protein n=1 Tax=Thiomicrospira sp. XS5 TaxID=1775636 RepID=UPI00074680F3|nr:DUF748 domain-containing protein [Thiomicrospira sp. XS5]KUJ75767.1 hypothetical protein AVO42_10820 [Thiomicrospira sp. XS5]
MTALYSRWKSLKTRYKVLAYTLVLFGAFLLALPWALQKGFEQALLKQGAESVQIEKVSVNLFTGRLEIFNLDVEVKNHQYLHLGHLKVDLSWTALFHKNIKIQELAIFDTRIEIDYRPGERIQVAGLSYSLDKKPSETPPTEKQDPFSWGLGIQSLELNKAVLELKTPELDKHIEFDKVLLEKAINWQPDDAAQLTFVIQEDQNHLEGKFQMWPFAEKQRLSGDIVVKNLDLSTYRKYLPPEILELSGLVFGDVKLDAVNVNGELKVNQRGHLSFQKLAFEQKDLRVVGNHINWNGDIRALVRKGHTAVQAQGEWRLKNIGVHAQTTNLRLDEVHWKNHSQVDVKDGVPKVTSQGEMELKHLAVADKDLALDNAQVNWQGEVQVSQPDKNGIEIVLPKSYLTADEFLFKQLSTEAKLSRLNWTGPVKVTIKSGEKTTDPAKAETPIKVALSDNHIKLSGVAVKADEANVDVNQLNWQGGLDITQSNQSGLLVSLPSSALAMEEVQFSQPKTEAKLAHLDWKGPAKITVKSAESKNDQTPVDIVLTDNHIALTTIGVNADGSKADVSRLNWQGGIQVGTLPHPTVQTDGRLDVKQLTTVYQDLTAGLKALDWKGQTQLTVTETPQVETAGQLALQSVKLDNTRTKMTVTDVANLKTGLAFTAPQAVSLKDLNVKGLKVASSQTYTEPLFSTGGVTIDRVSVKNNQAVDIGKVALQDMNVTLAFDEQTKLGQVEALKAALQPSPQPKSDKAQAEQKSEQKAAKQDSANVPKEKAPPFQLQQFDITGDSHVYLTSTGITPPLHQDMRIETGHLGRLDSTQAHEKTPLDIQAAIDQFTKVTVKGDFQPFSPKVNADIKANIQDMDLYAFSPLIRRSLGYRIQSGSLNMKSDIQIKKDILDADNRLKLVGFEMEEDSVPVPSKTNGNDVDKAASDVDKAATDLGKAASAGSMSLALNLLRDGDNNIDLSVPVNGDLSDPGFNIAQVISVAFFNAMKGGSKAMLAMTLQPYGAIYLAAEYAYKKAGETTLQPVQYKPGLDEWRADMPEYLKKITKLLKDKKSITLKVCGFYNQADRDYWVKEGMKGTELEDKLYQLARERQVQVKTWLVEKGGISSSRLTTCYPSFESVPDSGVMLSM